MADTVSQPVDESTPAQGGHGIKATLKRIKPGEWVLIAIGIISLVVFYIWYQNNQANNTSSATTSPNPDWSGAQTDDSGTYAGELADLLSQIASGQFTTPSTGTTSLAGAAGGTSSSSGGTSAGTVSQSGIAGSALGTGSAPETTGIVGTINSNASSGSGITGGGNSSPTIKASDVVNNSVNGTMGSTGNVGVAISSLPGSQAQAITTKSKAPANATSGSVAATGAAGKAQTVGSQQVQKPTFIPVNFVSSVPIHTTPAVTPSTKPASTTVKAPTKAPANVRAG